MEGRSVALPGGRDPSIFTCARLHAGVVRGSKHFEHLHHIVQPVVAELVEDEREERDDSDYGEDQLGVLLHLGEKRVIRRSSLRARHSDLKKAEKLYKAEVVVYLSNFQTGRQQLLLLTAQAHQTSHRLTCRSFSETSSIQSVCNQAVSRSAAAATDSICADQSLPRKSSS